MCALRGCYFHAFCLDTVHSIVFNIKTIFHLKCFACCKYRLHMDDPETVVEF